MGLLRSTSTERICRAVPGEGRSEPYGGAFSGVSALPLIDLGAAPRKSVQAALTFCEVPMLFVSVRPHKTPWLCELLGHRRVIYSVYPNGAAKRLGCSRCPHTEILECVGILDRTFIPNNPGFLGD